MGRVIVLGSINVDLETRVAQYPQPGEKVVGALARHAGGKGANQAVAARAQGADVVMVGAVGGDDAGRAALNRLHAHGIRLSVEVIQHVPTGHAIVLTDGLSNAIVVVPGANAEVGPRPLRPIRELGPSDIVLVQLETPVETVCDAVRHAARYGARVVVNLAPYAELPDDVVEIADPLIVPQVDLAAVESRGVTPRSLIVLRGKDGLDWDGVHHPAVLVPDAEVADTLGATDALIGALVAALAQGQDPTAAAAVGQRAAAANVRHAGAQADPLQ